MTRSDIEKAIYEESHDLDYQFVPWSNEKVIKFTIQQINAALSELEMDVENHDGFGVVKTEVVLKKIRALKIGEAK